MLIVVFLDYVIKMSSVKYGLSSIISTLVLAFLISPFGLPAVAGLVIALFNGITDGMMALYNRDFLLGGFDY